MKCVILAAGRGSRLSPLTDIRPKCLVEFAGRPLLEWQLDALRIAGISDIHVVTGYLSEQIEAYRLKCWYNAIWESSNMIESMLCLRQLFMTENDDILVLYSDLIYEPYIISKLIKTDGDIVISVDQGWKQLWQARMSDPLSDAESLRYDEDGILLEIGQRVNDATQIQAQYMGMMKFTRTGRERLIDFWDKADFYPSWAHGRTKQQAFMTDLLNAMINKNFKINTCVVEHGWLEVDSLNDLRRYETDLADRSDAAKNNYLPDLSWGLLK